MAGDGVQLARQPCLHLLRRCGTVAALHAFAGLARQLAVRRLARRQLQRRPDGAAIGQGWLAGGSDAGHAGQRLGQRRKALGHLGRAQPVQIHLALAAIGQRVGRYLVQPAVPVDGGQQAQPGAFLALQAVDRLHGDRCDAKAVAQRQQLLGVRQILPLVDLQSQIRLFVEDAGQLGDIAGRGLRIAGPQAALDPAAPSARQADQTFLVRGQRRPSPGRARPARCGQGGPGSATPDGRGSDSRPGRGPAAPPAPAVLSPSSSPSAASVTVMPMIG